MYMREKQIPMQKWICMKCPHSKSCWSWSVSQFSTCMSLSRHGCQRHSFLNSQTDSQMYTFPDQMNWQFVQILMDSKFHSKLRVLDTDDVKQETSLFSVQGKSAWYCFKAVVLLSWGSSRLIASHVDVLRGSSRVSAPRTWQERETNP